LGTTSLFVIIACKEKWSKKFERLLKDNGLYFVVLIIFWWMYILSYLKGIIPVIDAPLPHWVGYIAIYFGLALMFYIPIVGILTILKEVKKENDEINRKTFR